LALASRLESLTRDNAIKAIHLALKIVETRAQNRSLCRARG
jgi:hypothetical protein